MRHKHHHCKHITHLNRFSQPFPKNGSKGAVVDPKSRYQVTQTGWQTWIWFRHFPSLRLMIQVVTSSLCNGMMNSISPSQVVVFLQVSILISEVVVDSLVVCQYLLEAKRSSNASLPKKPPFFWNQRSFWWQCHWSYNPACCEILTISQCDLWCIYESVSKFAACI